MPASFPLNFFCLLPSGYLTAGGVTLDLCDKNEITGYPSLSMYKDGERVEEFFGVREPEFLKEFLGKHANTKPGTKEAPPTPPKQPPPKPTANLDGEVLLFSQDNFDKTLKEGPAFVKFFAPWCGHCKKLAPVWKQLARHMQFKVTIAEVNCDEHQALCRTHSIQGYPTLVWFSKLENGAESPQRHEYNGGRKLEQLRAFVDKATAA
jgi:thioredoxin domain-containing protein 5